MNRNQNLDIVPIEWVNRDKKVYGSKRINLLRISQEKKIKKLRKKSNSLTRSLSKESSKSPNKSPQNLKQPQKPLNIVKNEKI